MKKYKKNKRKIFKFNIDKFIIDVLFLVLLSVFLYSTFNTVMWFVDSKKTNKEIKKIQKDNDVEKVEESEETVVIENTSPYYEFLNTELIDVDFNKLKQRNNEVVGWIQVPGTKINYPFVQTSNNEYYLKKSIDRKNNSAGWIFLDYRNNINNFDQNTIIYGHGRLEKTMFGSLKDVLTPEWQNNKSNYVVKIVTENMTSVWQMFSAYHIPTTSDYLYINFISENQFNNFNTMLINRSMIDFKSTVSTTDKIITLSTCYNNNERMVVHAKLIKYQLK